MYPSNSSYSPSTFFNDENQGREQVAREAEAQPGGARLEQGSPHSFVLRRSRPRFRMVFHRPAMFCSNSLSLEPLPLGHLLGYRAIRTVRCLSGGLETAAENVLRLWQLDDPSRLVLFQF